MKKLSIIFMLLWSGSLYAFNMGQYELVFSSNITMSSMTVSGQITLKDGTVLTSTTTLSEVSASSATATYLNKIATASITIAELKVSSISYQKDGYNIIVTSAVWGGSGGGTGTAESTTSTTTWEVSAGGDVFVSSSQFEAVLGSWLVVPTTLQITGIQGFCITPSSYDYACFNVAIATAGVGNSSWTYLLDGTDYLYDIEVGTNTQQTNIISISTQVFKGARLALHGLRKCIGSGQASGWGVRLYGWFFKNAN